MDDVDISVASFNSFSPQSNLSSNSPCAIVAFAYVAPPIRPPSPVEGLQQILGRRGLHGAERDGRRAPLGGRRRRVHLMRGGGREPLVVLAEVGPERRYVCNSKYEVA